MPLRAAANLKQRDRGSMETFSEFQALGEDLERVLSLHRLCDELKDPQFERAFREALAAARPSYDRIRSQLPPETCLSSLDWLFAPLDQVAAPASGEPAPWCSRWE